MRGGGSNRQGGWGRSCRIYVCLQWAHLTQASWTMEGSAWLLDRTGHNKTPGCGDSWSYGERPPSCTCLVPGDEWNRPTTALKGLYSSQGARLWTRNRTTGKLTRVVEVPGGGQQKAALGAHSGCDLVQGCEHSLEAMTSADNVSMGEGRRVVLQTKQAAIEPREGKEELILGGLSIEWGWSWGSSWCCRPCWELRTLRTLTKNDPKLRKRAKRNHRFFWCQTTA